MKRIIFLLAFCFTVSMAFATSPPLVQDDHPTIMVDNHQSQAVVMDIQNISSDAFIATNVIFYSIAGENAKKVRKSETNPYIAYSMASWCTPDNVLYKDNLVPV